MAKVIRKPGPGKAKLEAMLEGLEDADARVGWFPGDVYESGTPVAYIAAIHENGVPEKNIPARPFLSVTATKNRQKWKQAAREIAIKVANGEVGMAEGMERLGALAAAHVKMTIGELSGPPLAEGTVAARRRKKDAGEPVGSLTKPLQETDMLHSSVKHEVVST